MNKGLILYAVADEIDVTAEVSEVLDAWVQRARAGDEQAFASIVRSMQGRIRSFCRRFLSDETSGDDAAQEAFIRMWRGIRRYEPRGSFASWAFQIARNVCIDSMRSTKRIPFFEKRDEPQEDPAEVAELRASVARAIADLEEPYRSTFLMREAGLTYEEVAVAQSLPVGTIRSRLHVARKRLAESLSPYLFGGDDQ